jgi:hypothetical protein
MVQREGVNQTAGAHQQGLHEVSLEAKICSCILPGTKKARAADHSKRNVEMVRGCRFVDVI